MGQIKQPAPNPFFPRWWFFRTTGVAVVLILLLSRWIDLIYAFLIVLVIAIPVDVAIVRSQRRRQLEANNQQN